jgi:prepilin-type processing-associated H-X9-DG protein
VWTNESNLYEAWQRYFSFARFDHTRHRNRMNVVFVDGHAQTVNMPDPKRRDDPANRGDFDTIGLTRGIVFR